MRRSSHVHVPDAETSGPVCAWMSTLGRYYPIMNSRMYQCEINNATTGALTGNLGERGRRTGSAFSPAYALNLIKWLATLISYCFPHLVPGHTTALAIEVDTHLQRFTLNIYKFPMISPVYLARSETLNIRNAIQPQPPTTTTTISTYQPPFYISIKPSPSPSLNAIRDTSDLLL